MTAGSRRGSRARGAAPQLTLDRADVALRAALVDTEGRRQRASGLPDVGAGLCAEDERPRPEEGVGADDRGGENGDDR
jgi:hypothetical protein